MMINKKIEINFKDFTGSCMLLPKYDLEAGILEFASNIHRKWEYGIDINGSIIFDIDNECKIANCDLLIPKKMWKRINALPFKIISNTKSYKDLLFNKSTIDIKSFNADIDTFLFNEKLYILFDKPEDINIDKLSDKCEVLSFNNELKGLL